jgi:two-component system response regulator MprA
VVDASTGQPLPLVLVADDEPGIRDLLCEVLAEAGFRTQTAADGGEVVELAVRHQPVLIVLDVMMPKMDGYTTLTRLRGHPLTKEIPVIILTGQAEPFYRTLSVGVGAVAHLTKPVLPDQLTETARRILAGRSL